MAVVNNSGVILSLLLNELSESADFSYIDFYYHIFCYLAERSGRIESCAEHTGTVRIRNFVEEIVPSYSDPAFQSHFRMTRSTFQELLQVVAPHTEVRTINLEKRTLACIWYLSNLETFRTVADRFNLSKGSLHYCLTNFCRTLSLKLIKDYIKWPQPEEYSGLAERSSQRAGFPGAIGFVDGTHIPIPGPGKYRASYICRKGYPAMHMQAVCDSSLKILDVFCAYPGSVHDARVFRESPLATLLAHHPLPNQYHLLGDSAYGLTSQMLVPYRDNGHLTPAQKAFNNAHSSTRVDIERCFGLLKGKFRKLKFLDMRQVHAIPHVIVACCVLHNFRLSREAFNDQDIDLEITDENATCDTMKVKIRGHHSKSAQEKRKEISMQLV